MKKMINFIDKYKLYISAILIINLIVDVLAYPTFKLFDTSIHLGTFLRPLLLLIYIIYILGKKTRHKYFLIPTLIFVSLSFISKILFITNLDIIYEVQLTLKYMTFIVSFLFFDAVIDIKDITKTKENFYTFVHFLIIAIFLIFALALVTNTQINSYSAVKTGSHGWFFSGNEIANLIAITFPLGLYLLFANIKSLKHWLYYLLSISIVLNIGTKVPWLSIFLTFFATLIYYIAIKFLKKVKFDKFIIVTGVFIALFVITIPLAPAYKNIQVQTEWELIETGKPSPIATYRVTKVKEITKYIAKHKVNSLTKNMKIVFGEGIFSNKDTPMYRNFTEIDLHDIYYSYGLIGHLLNILLISYVGLYMLKFIVKFGIKNISLADYLFSFTAILGLGSAYFSGHFFFSISVVTMYSLILVLLRKNVKSKLNDEPEEKRVMFISSVGGHLTQLLGLKEMFNNYKYVLVTEKNDVTKDLYKKYNTRYLVYGSRQYIFKYIFIFTFNILKSFYLFIRYCPHTVVTTGTHTAVPMCYIAKLFGSKVIFIESFAKRTGQTLSGKLVYPIADVFVVQWESMLEFYPKAQYWGWIY